MRKSRLIGALCAVIYMFLSTATSAALIGVNGGLIYDDVLNITWSQPDNQNPRNWDDANTWAAGLTLGGVSGWRLPYTSVLAGAGPTVSAVNCASSTEAACADDELGYMFYYNLGGTFFQAITLSGNAERAKFPTLESQFYWSGTEFDFSDAWGFAYAMGIFSSAPKSGGNRTWAVHDGKVGAVPIPAAVWLFGSGLLGLIGISRRKKVA